MQQSQLINLEECECQSSIQRSAGDLFDQLVHPPEETDEIMEIDETYKNLPAFCDCEPPALKLSPQYDLDGSEDSRSDVSNLPSYYSDQQEPEQDPASTQVIQRKSRKGGPSTKNFLVTIRNLIGDHFENQGMGSHPAIRTFLSGTSTNLKAYEELFRQPELKDILARMFRYRFLQRSLQLSRTNPSQIKIYLPLFRKLEESFRRERLQSIH